MEDKLIQLCDPAKLEYLINDAPNNTLSSAQIQNAVCSEKDYGIHTVFANTCGVIAEKIPVLAEGLYRCTIDSASIISSFKEMPCNPIRWNPTALVNKFCSTVSNNIGTFNTTTLTTETAFWDSTTPAEDPNNDIIKLIGVGAAATIAIGGMIYTGYKCFKSSKNTPKNTANTELELNSRGEDIESASNLLNLTFSMREDFQAAGIRISAFNRQADKESTSLLLPTLEESNTSTELHYDIPQSNRPVTGIYEEIGQKIETSNNIIKLIGVGAAATIAIGGMIYTGYKCFKSSKNTPKNTANTELELNSRGEDIESASNLLNLTFSMREDFQAAGIRISAFNRQADKESTSLLLPTLEESNTSTELHYDIPQSNRPVTGIYEEIGQKIETSNNIIKLIGVGAAATIAIGGMIFTGYKCFKSSKNTPKNTANTELELNSRGEDIESASNLLNPTFSMREDFQAVGIRISAFNRQADKESTSLLLPTLEESNTSTELHYDIPKSNRPVTGIYEEIGQKIETSNNIIKLIGVGAAATIAIGGMIYTGYKCFKSSKNTPKNTANTELELNSRGEDIESTSNLLNPTFSMREDFQAAGIRISAFNRQEDKESTSLLLPTLEESNTSTELHYDIPKSNRPVTGIYEEIGQKIETSNIPDAAREVCNRLNDLVDELELTNIVISSNDHTVPNNEPALLGDDSTVIEIV